MALQLKEAKVTSPDGAQNLLTLLASDTRIQGYAGVHWRVVVAAYAGIFV